MVQCGHSIHSEDDGETLKRFKPGVTWLNLGFSKQCFCGCVDAWEGLFGRQEQQGGGATEATRPQGGEQPFDQRLPSSP